MELVLDLTDCVGFALGTEERIFPSLPVSAVPPLPPPHVPSRHFFTTSGFGKPSALNSLQIYIWVSKSEALNLANQAPSLTFPLYVTWSTSLIDTWKISFTHLIPGSTGDLGLWNAPAARGCLGCSTTGLVRGPV